VKFYTKMMYATVHYAKIMPVALLGMKVATCLIYKSITCTCRYSGTRHYQQVGTYQEEKNEYLSSPLFESEDGSVSTNRNKVGHGLSETQVPMVGTWRLINLWVTGIYA
jgi:hypothetical protein